MPFSLDATRRAFLAFLASSTLFWSAENLQGGQDSDADQAKDIARIQLVIDYGDGVQKHFTRIAWKKEMTILDALEAAKRHPRGIRFEYRGSGKTAFLSQIDDLKNEGRGRNWIYEVDGKLGDRSFAIYPLQPSDVVLWKFAEYR